MITRRSASRNDDATGTTFRPAESFTSRCGTFNWFPCVRITQRSMKFPSSWNITFPQRIRERVHGISGDESDVLTHPLRKLSHEMIHERKNVFAAFPQRRDL